MDTHPDRLTEEWLNRRLMNCYFVLIGFLLSVGSSARAFAQGTTNQGIPDSAPFLSAIADQTVDEDSPTIPLRLLYGDAQTPFSELRLSVASSNEKLLPAQNVLFNKGTPKELMVIVPAPDEHGVANVTLTVENAQGKRTSRTFLFTVRSVDDPPIITAESALMVLEDSQPQTVRFQVSDLESRPEDLTVDVMSSAEALIPLQNLRLEGNGRDRTLSLRPAPDQHGSAVIGLIVRDPQGAESRLELKVRVLPVNDPPQLGRIADQRIFVNQELAPLAFLVADDETPPADLVVKGFSSNPLLVSEDNILFGGFGESRTLSVRPAQNLTGSTVITIKAYDGEKLESSTSFLLTVDRENVPPQIAGLADITIDQDKSTGPVLFSIEDRDGSDELVRIAASSSNPALVANSGIQLSGAGPQRSLTIAPRPGASGMAEITLVATDGGGAEGRATFLLHVRPTALRPIALVFSASVMEDTPTEILLKAESPSARALTYAILAAPQKGVLSGEPPRLIYTPNPNVNGADAFEFKVSDGLLESLPATVSIAIQEVNDPPSISAVANRRTDPGKSTGPIRFSIEDLETPANKLLVSGRSSDPDLIPDQNILLTGQDASRDVTLVPVPGRTGTAVITLMVKDGGGLSASAVFELKVAEVSGAPKGEPQSVLTPEDVPVAIALRARDALGLPATFAIVDPPEKGTLSGFAPNLVYRPKPNETGQDRFTFKVSNETGESPAAAVEISIIPVNDPPLARSQSYTVNEDKVLEIELAATDAEKDPISFEVVSFPIKGKLSGSAPRLTYTPNPNEAGTDQFTFTASDGELVSVPGTIRITIDPVNDPPVASGLFVTGLEDTIISLSLKGRDVDGDPLTYLIGAQPAKGTLAGTPPDLVYIPNANTSGLDRFTYRVSDGKLSSEQEVVTIMVVPVNDPPVAESRFLSLAEDSSADILLRARDADNDPLIFLIVSGPSKGSLSGTPPQLNYKPEANFSGIDSFTFKVSDGTVESQPATITLSVRPINDPPIAPDQYVAVNEDTSQGILLTGSDPEGALLTFKVVDPPKHGSVAGAPPNLIYTPALDFNGEDSFTFKVSDGDLESAAATVRISVRPVNDAPLAENQFLTVTQGRSRLVTLTGADAEPGVLQFILTSLPAKGVLSGKPPNLVYLPNPNERGLDSFSFKVSDGVLESLPGTVQLVLTEKTGAPTISAIQDQTVRNGDSTPKLPFTIRDVESLPEKLVVAASSSAPEIVPVENIIVEGSAGERTVRVVPARGKFGSSTVTLVVWDEDGLAASTQFSLTVIRVVNDPPALSKVPDQVIETNQQLGPIQFEVNDPDTPLAKLQVSVNFSSPDLIRSDSVRLDGSGSRRTLTAQPAAGKVGVTSVTLSVSDGEQSVNVTFQLTILAPNQPPTIALIDPPDLTVVDPRNSLVIEAKASDPDGAIRRVDFYAGSTLIGSSSNAPYRFAWRSSDRGRYALSAKAIDDRAAEAASAPINILVDQPAGSVAVLTANDDPDLGLIRRYLFELPVQSRLIPRAEAKSENLVRQFDAVLWHQPAAAEVQSQDLTLLESLARVGTPLYFLGDSIVAAGRKLSESERARWQNLVHLKPGGTSWLSQVTILESSEHPVIKNGPVGSVARFAYPVTAQQSGLQAGLAGEVVLGRSGSFDLLVASVDAKSSARAFTHHLRLSGASDAAGTAEQSILFKNAIGWLIDKQSFTDLSVEVEPPSETVVVGQSFQYRIVIRHSGESPASQVAVTDTLPPGINLLQAQLSSGTWSFGERTATFELGQLSRAEIKTILVTAVATQPGSFSHWVHVQMLGSDAVQDNNSFDAAVQVVDAETTFPKLTIRRENADTIRVELPASTARANYALEASEDLIHWSRLNGGLTGPGTSATFSSASAPLRFFRVITINPPTAISPSAQR